MRTGITPPVIGLPQGVSSSGLRSRYRTFHTRNQRKRLRSLNFATIDEWEVVGVRTRFVGERCHECGSRPEEVFECWYELTPRSELRVICEPCTRFIGLVW